MEMVYLKLIIEAIAILEEQIETEEKYSGSAN